MIRLTCPQVRVSFFGDGDGSGQRAGSVCEKSAEACGPKLASCSDFSAPTAQATRFPREVYTFYDESDVREMLAAAGFGSAQFSRIGETSLPLAT